MLLGMSNIEISDLKNQLKEMDRLRKFDVENNSITLKGKADENDRLRKELDSLCGSGDEMKHKLEVLINAGVDVDSIVSGRVHGPYGPLEEYQGFREKIRALEVAGIDVDGIISGKVRYYSDVEQRLGYLMSELEATRKERDDLIERAALASDSEERLSALVAELGAMKEELDALEQNLDSLTREKDDMLKECFDVRRERDVLQIKVKEQEGLEAAYNKLQLKSANTYKYISEWAMKKHKSELEATIKQEDDLRKRDALASDFEDRLNALLGQLVATEEEQDALNQNKDSLTREKEDMMKEMFEIMRSERDSLQIKLEDLKAPYYEL